MKIRVLTLAVLAGLASSAVSADQLKKGLIDDAEVKLQFRARFEQVDPQVGDSIDLTTLRTRLTYKTGDMYNFFALAEVDDVREGDAEPGIADYKYTEINQSFIGYKAASKHCAKIWS